MELSLAQVGCRCGRRFAPMLQLLGVDRGSRVSPGLARRAAELATELPFARAAAQLLSETGHGLSPATVRRIVARAGERCDLTLPRSDVDDVPAMLIDGTGVPGASSYFWNPIWMLSVPHRRPADETSRRTPPRGLAGGRS